MFIVGKIDENPICFAGRVVIKMTFPYGKVQPFYKSTGRHSKMPDVWLPFDGADIYRNWFVKDRYIVKDEYGNNLPLHRFGSELIKEISDFLSVIDTSSAKVVEYIIEVNHYLFGKDEVDYEVLANLIERKDN